MKAVAEKKKRERERRETEGRQSKYFQTFILGWGVEMLLSPLILNP